MMSYYMKQIQLVIPFLFWKNKYNSLKFNLNDVHAFGSFMKFIKKTLIFFLILLQKIDLLKIEQPDMENEWKKLETNLIDEF
jgi:hypothetical protein